MSQDTLQPIAAREKKLNESAIAGSSPVPCPWSSYVRYGTEWESELMMLPKKHLIRMLRNELIASMRQTLSAVSDTPETDKSEADRSGKPS